MPIAIEARGLSKEFSGFYAVHDVDFSIRSGEVHALIGPNGAGKTTLFNLLTRFLTPTTGRIIHGGVDVTNMAPAAVARRGVVRSFQISAAFPSLTVRENIKIALLRTYQLHLKLFSSFSTHPRLEEKANQILDDFNLTTVRDSIVGTLPYGRKRILELAVTVAPNPSTILLDEPTSGLGTEDVSRVAEIIRNLGNTRTVLVVEHNLNVVAKVSQKVTVMVRGQILVDGTYEEVARHPDVQSAYMGRTNA